jgi:hypothetical protein
MRSRVMARLLVLVATSASLVVPAGAHADRDADAPLRAPRALDDRHVAFTLHGGPWAQVVGALSGTPLAGTFELKRSPERGTTCRLRLTVGAAAQRRAPRVGRRTVRLRPDSRSTPLLRVTARGTRGSIRWWAGTVRRGERSHAAVGVAAPAPTGLRSATRRYVVTYAEVEPAFSTPQGACAAHARRVGGPVTRRLGRTLRLAPGPPVFEAPFVTA